MDIESLAWIVSSWLDGNQPRMHSSYPDRVRIERSPAANWYQTGANIIFERNKTCGSKQISIAHTKLKHLRPHVQDYRTVQGSCAQETQYLLADSQFLEAIRGNGLVNQSNHGPHSPQLFQIYFCLTFPSIFFSTCALIIMETYDCGTWSLKSHEKVNDGQSHWFCFSVTLLIIRALVLFSVYTQNNNKIRRPHYAKVFGNTFFNMYNLILVEGGVFSYSPSVPQPAHQNRYYCQFHSDMFINFG